MPVAKVVRTGLMGIGSNLGSRVYVVGVPGSGCPYSTVQSAIAAAETGYVAPLPNRAVLVTPGDYDEDALVRQNNVHFFGLGRPRVGSLTFSDCTLKSIDIFNASGAWTDLVADPALFETPERNVVRDIDFARQTGPAWTGMADASLRFLGQASGGSKLGKMMLELWGSHVYSTFTGGNRISLAQVFNVAFHNCFVKGFIEAKQIGGLWLEESRCIGKVGLLRDTAQPEPGVGPWLGMNGQGSHVYDLVLEGDAPLVGADYMRKCTFDVIHDQAKTKDSVAEFRDCYVEGDIEIANLGPLVTFKAGRYMGAVIGAGAAGFTGVVGSNS
jgi:hypothetical protein